MLVRVTGANSNPAKVSRGTHAPVANTAAIITIAAVAGKTHTIHGVQWSYSVAPTGGNLKIESNSVTLWQIDIPSSGPGGFNFTLPATPNQNCVITLAAGAGTCLGKLNVEYVTEV